MTVDKTIFLIGMMGSGKSTVGAQLATSLVLPFLDTDVAIEKKEGKSIQQIFEQEGEVYFRLLEQRFLQNLTSEVSVVACGGGMPCFFNNMELLQSKGIVVCLEAPPALLHHRIKAEQHRPKLQSFARFSLLKKQREATYRKAHFIVDAAQQKELVVAEVMTLLALMSNQ